MSLMSRLGRRGLWVRIVNAALGFIAAEVAQQMYEGMSFAGDLPDEVFGGAVLVAAWYTGHTYAGIGGGAYAGVQAAQRVVSSAQESGSGSGSSGGN